MFTENTYSVYYSLNIQQVVLNWKRIRHKNSSSLINIYSENMVGLESQINGNVLQSVQEHIIQSKTIQIHITMSFHFYIRWVCVNISIDLHHQVFCLSELWIKNPENLKAHLVTHKFLDSFKIYIISPF